VGDFQAGGLTTLTKMLSTASYYRIPLQYRVLFPYSLRTKLSEDGESFNSLLRFLLVVRVLELELTTTSYAGSLATSRGL
jgi:hypothetical protein